ncbi:MAG: hypothetical protein ACFFAN_10265 [Promethearchaeota archaeon]
MEICAWNVLCPYGHDILILFENWELNWERLRRHRVCVTVFCSECGSLVRVFKNMYVEVKEKKASENSKCLI